MKCTTLLAFIGARLGCAMNPHWRALGTMGLVAVLLGATAPSFSGGDGPSYDLSWHTIDGGGGVSTGSGFELHGSVGQPDTGPALVGGDFELLGGFWAPADGSTCAADIDGNGAVDFDDLLRILAAWGNSGGPEDIDGSGTVEFDDLLIVLAAWGPCP